MMKNYNNSDLKLEAKMLELEFARLHKSKEDELLLNDVFEDNDLPVWE